MSSGSVSVSAAQQKQQRISEVKRRKAWEKEQVRYPFWFGGSASCFAACVTHPLDLGIFPLFLAILYIC
jgi:hypothetical protein